ncbi:helix-turn-helix transcriptional regulator [Undibacterium sp. CY18W]|uniref:Helix-turn-helix transcriptional regulator n=1 Tax=Undibacterium hunanense TaxID=2762292 RepID=A0ABR6ZU32_9BURK|nr:helix-turn-helix domain-containing protein [Undibacterium hunanense]MBC3919124.1 helix-turn-helix transcriptional regulator [Undibacterium hunanense]
MVIRRTRTEFWGAGPQGRETPGFSFHLLAANPPEDEVQTHMHEEAHFVLVLSGAYMSSARHAPAMSNTPLLIFNPAGTTHRDRFLGGRGRFLAISGGDAAGFGFATSLRDLYALQVATRIAADFQRKNLSQLQLEGGAQQLLAACSPLTSDESRHASQPPVWLKQAFEMIFTSDDPGLSVADVAAFAGVHPVHLARVFRRYLHCSPGDYLRGRRLERAAAVIGTATASLADAAFATGFVDQAHLTRSFRQTFGLTPGAWRARVQGRPDEQGRMLRRYKPVR